MLVSYYTHKERLFFSLKPSRNDHQVNQTQRSPIKEKTTDIKMKNKSLQDLEVGS